MPLPFRVPLQLPFAALPQAHDVAAPLTILVRCLSQLLQAQRNGAQIARQMRQPLRRGLAEKPGIDQMRQLIADIGHRLGPNRLVAQHPPNLVIGGQNRGGHFAHLPSHRAQPGLAARQQCLERRPVAWQRLIAQKSPVEDGVQQILAQGLLRAQANEMQGHALKLWQIARQRPEHRPQPPAD